MRERKIVKEGSSYVLYSKDGSKKLGTFPTKAKAEKHEQEVNYFKTRPRTK